MIIVTISINCLIPKTDFMLQFSSIEKVYEGTVSVKENAYEVFTEISNPTDTKRRKELNKIWMVLTTICHKYFISTAWILLNSFKLYAFYIHACTQTFVLTDYTYVCYYLGIFIFWIFWLKADGDLQLYVTRVRVQAQM